RGKPALAERAETLYPVATQFRLSLDVLNRLGRPEPAGAKHAMAVQSAAFHRSISCLSKFQSRRPETIFLNGRSWLMPQVASFFCKKVLSAPDMSSMTASLPRSCV